MGDFLRRLFILLFWLFVAALFASAISDDVRDVFQDYIPFFEELDPVIDWLEDFLGDLWEAVFGD